MDTMLQELLQKQAAMEEQIKAALRRIDEQKQLTESVHELATSVKLLASAQQQTEKKTEELSRDIDEIKQRPARRWDLIVTTILTAAATFFISKFGIK